MTNIDWSGAACVGQPPEMWFPEGYSHRESLEALEAKRICHTCPLEAACLEWAMGNETGRAKDRAGIYGGLDELERTNLARGRTPRVLQPCGTRSAYRRHLAAGETCEKCKPRAWYQRADCSVDGCGNSSRCRGMCEKHYRASRKLAAA